ncbi:abortive infection system antitoxin AbiGi family protein [Micrococcus sp. HOU01]|uniref:abortive infection system antitoxin AbiGi family protein n=1 Tax=Micrococcus sp. HOU01 TaxID=3101753 RepID=UPI002D7A1F84|nr:abortive infection system antitoxin AbiGi family protein [Micrococcus sp. HOU1]WRQ42643.1 abortive infection system antitoxin AbiGi family protein [Micrococcus sp. HOU1]
MSQFVVHFTDDPRVFAEILATGYLQASGPYGFSWARKVPQVADRHHSVCFSEVPLNNVERLVRRHGNYGIGFTKDFIRSNQGARVWYVDQGSVQARRLNEHLKDLVSRGDFNHPMWELTPLIDLVMPGRYEWDWEREWRIRGALRFKLSDIAFTITPEGIDEVAEPTFFVSPEMDFTVIASPRPLADYMEKLVQEFFQTFEDPVNSLPVDGGEYVWIVEQHETEDAVDLLFPELEESILRQLVDYLNSESYVWVSSADVASIWE